MALTMSFTAFADIIKERWTSVRVNGVIVFIDVIGFNSTKNDDLNYTLSWNNWKHFNQNTNSSIRHYRIEKLVADNSVETTGWQIPTKWQIVTDTIDTTYSIFHTLQSFDLNGQQLYRLSSCENGNCEIVSQLEYHISINDIDSLKPQNLTIDIFPIYNENHSTSQSLVTATAQSKDLTSKDGNNSKGNQSNPYQQGHGFSMLSGHQNPQGHGLGQRQIRSKNNHLKNRNPNVVITSNQAVLKWTQQPSANHYKVVKTDIRGEYPTKSTVTNITQEYNAEQSTFTFELVGGTYSFAVYACENDPNDNSAPLCSGASLIPSTESVVTIVEAEKPFNLRILEGQQPSDGIVNDYQQFTLTWGNPTTRTDSKGWSLYKYEIYGELTGLIEEVYYNNSNAEYTIIRNSGNAK